MWDSKDLKALSSYARNKQVIRTMKFLAPYVSTWLVYLEIYKSIRNKRLEWSQS